MTDQCFVREEAVAVAKVFSLHEFELRPGVEPAELERVFRAEVAPSPSLPGFRASLLRGDRGERDGRFLVLMEMESEGTRDRYFPEPDGRSEEFLRFMEQHPDTAAAWDAITSLTVQPAPYTDYVVVVE
jgi:hypothetical protein